MLSTDTKLLAGTILAHIMGGVASAGNVPTERDTSIDTYAGVAIACAKALDAAAKKASPS